MQIICCCCIRYNKKSCIVVIREPVLYSYFRSTASWRVRIALAYKEIEYEYKSVHLVKDGGQQHSDEYRSLNPMRQVPTLIIDGHTLTQSLPIIEYLEETRPTKSLLPSDPHKRAQARSIAEIVNSGIQPIQNLSVLQKVNEITGSDEEKMKWGHYWIHRGFQALEAVLKDSSEIYCVGNDITIADIALVPQVYNATRFKVDMSEFPVISRVHAELIKHPAFIAADQKNQPDTPDDLK